MDGTAAAQPTHASVESLVDEVVRNPDALVAPLSTYSGDPTAAIDRIGALKDMGLDFGWGPTATFEWLIEHVYLMSSMGWGGSIVVSTIVLRAGMFYFQRQGSNNMAKMAALQPLTKDYQAKMKEAITANDTEKVDFYKYRMAAIYKEAKINPITGMIPMVWQLIFGFGAWRCIRNMSALPVPGIDQGGWLWFQNLAVADPYYLVPAIGGGLMYLTMRLGGETGTADQTMARGTATALQVGMPIMMVVVMANQPAGVALYVLVSSTTSMFTATLLRNPNFRASTGMTPLPSRAAQEVWTKVARGEINLHDVVDDKGNIIYKPQPAYQAPTRVTPKSPKKPKTLTHRGLNIKNNTTALPSHLDAKPKRQKVAPIDPATRDRDDDFEYGLPSGIGKKIDWFGRNYSPTYMFRRLRNWATSQTDEARKQREAKKKAEAKSRFGGGR
ncbi:hypothetical protein K491DRAFT_606077 [Lophiostoma macrostomum CBS 122681]|uniref:Membrane insertase YidC/Oxa/ALB C-terminal domain-containing protein n=1 Tax=Lophiostoma macrostomum CBS 122681 TaxID=1314788 RepID=A0A6A6SZC3_9PLEO|nr:hypothetical protein K491DRAFT_606077 [Lophiostoma macrostomum CBS 122681]